MDEDFWKGMLVVVFGCGVLPILIMMILVALGH